MVLIRGQRWRVARFQPYASCGQLDVDGCDAGNRGSRQTFLLPFETVHRLPAQAVRPRVVSYAAWRRAASATLAAAAPGWSSLRSAARSDFNLIPFQLEPAIAMTR